MSQGQNETAKPVGPLKLALTFVYLLVWPALFFLAAGTTRWLEGWLFMAWFTVGSAALVSWLYRRDPALLAERYRAPGTGGQSRHDRYVTYAIGLVYLAWMFGMPLDAGRFHWTPRLPLAVEVVVGGGLLALASLFFFRAFADNTFASPLVRAQHERQQHVVQSGVYAIVRHPMYLGASLLFFGGALLLGSAVGLVAALAGTVVLAYRIGDEEALLVRELDGYDAYRHKVRFRLVPGVW